MATTVKAVIRKDRIDAAGNAPVMIRITVDKKHTYHQIGERVPVEAWMASGKIVDKYRNASLINAKIDKRIAEIKANLLKEELQDNIITPATAKKALTVKKAAKYDVYSYMKHLTETAWVGLKKPGTIRQAKGEINKLKGFAPSLRFEDVTAEWLVRFEHYMTNTLKNKANTVWKSFKILRTVFNEAKRDGVYKDYPFANYKVKGPKAGSRAHLTVTELTRFEAAVLGHQWDTADDIAGRFFIFSCYTGLRFGDCKAFRSEKHILSKKRILLSMQKTEDPVSLLLTPKIKWALELISEHEGQLPTNEECNRALKDIAKKAKINKSLSFHSARHTFGYMCAENNVPIEVTAKLMGHRSTKVTAIYYHISNKNADDWMMKMQG